MPNKYKWEIVAKDYNAPFIKSLMFVSLFFIQAKLLNISRAVMGIASRKNKIEYFADLSTWREAHNDLKREVEKDYKYVEKLIGKTDSWCRNMNKWTEKHILKANLNKLNGKNLINLFKKFVELQTTSYALGVALPILDFGEFSFVEGNLEKYLKKNVSKNEYQKYYSTFTEPVRNSFAQDQEEDLLKLMGVFYGNKKWITDVMAKNFQEIKSSYPKFYALLKRHTKKYCWVYYVFTGPAYTEENFFDFIKENLKRKIDPRKKLAELRAKKEKTKLFQKEFIKKLKPDKFNLAIINLAGKIVWAKPRRKDYQSKSYYHLEKLQKEIAKRLHISLNQARSASVETLENALVKNKEIDIDKVNSIYDFHVCIPGRNGDVEILYGDNAERFYKRHIKKEIAKIDKDIKELKGATAVAGKVRGVVKIVNQPSEMAKMEYGDILVAVATAPSIVPAMKKASAIITDEGGLTCHASIVSRELNTPCVVGTKIATKVFKDGDLVEVDANKGVIKILK